MDLRQDGMLGKTARWREHYARVLCSCAMHVPLYMPCDMHVHARAMHVLRTSSARAMHVYLRIPCDMHELRA